MKNSVLIIDYGSQVTELIARKIRELNIYSELKNPDITLEEITHLAPKAIILSGGPYSVYEEGAPQIDQKIFDLGIPILGICYGQQLICHTLGGKVEKSSTREFGKAVIKHEEDSPLMHGVGDIAIHDTDAYPHLIETDHSLVNQVWMSHSDKVEKIPEGFKVIATTKDTPYAVIANEEQKIYGLQFHPEVSHSIRGHKIIENFILKIAKCEKNWDMGNFKDSQIKAIKETVGDKNVICGLSGGVDSSVVAALISRAIDKQLTCIFVDHGLLRFNEKEEVIEAFKDFDINFFLEGAQEAFVIVVEAFGEGDRDTLNGLLAPNVFDAFDQAIAEREKNDETMQTEIHAIKKAEITDARLDRKTALITVRFTAEETSVIKDSNGEIVSGHPDKVTQMRDMWVFSREVRARDPRWFLHETKGDFDGDNETIPNSDGQ
mgnify:CR=1 FL=1